MSRFERILLPFTPTLLGGLAYTANDQVGAVNTLENAVADTKGSVELESVVVVDKAKAKQALDIFFFDEAPTLVSADNTEFELLDSEMLKCIGVVSIAAGDYADSKNSAIACKRDISLILQAARKSKSLYCVLVTRGTPTYAVGDLSVKLGLLQP